jgi:adenosine kinase
MATVGEDFGDYRAWLDCERRGYIADEGRPWRVHRLVLRDDRSGLLLKLLLSTLERWVFRHPISERVAQKPDLVMVSPSAPDAMMKFPAECRELDIKYLYDPSQQVLRLEGAELARDMEGAYFLFCNDYEFGLISKKTGWSLDQILEHVKVLVITRGKDGADLYSDGNSVTSPPCLKMRSSTRPAWAMPSAAVSSTGYSTASIGSCAARSARFPRYTVLNSAARRTIPIPAEDFVKRFRSILTMAESWMRC